jgi:hypothetical protein
MCWFKTVGLQEKKWGLSEKRPETHNACHSGQPKRKNLNNPSKLIYGNRGIKEV